MVAAALEAEVDAYIADAASECDKRGHRLVVRNGHAEPRTNTTAAGRIEVRAPWVNDKWVDTELALMYLHGMSSGDFAPALAGFVSSTAGLSASVITRLSTSW